MLTPVTDNCHLWQTFLMTNSFKELTYKPPSVDNLNVAIEILSYIASDVDQITQTINNSSDAKEHFGKIMDQMRVFIVYATPTDETRHNLKVMDKLYRSIINGMNTPFKYDYQNYLVLRNQLSRPIGDRLLEEMIAIISVMTKEKPSVDEVNQCLNQFEALMWKNFTVNKNKPEALELVEKCLTKYAALVAKKNEYVTPAGKQFVTTIIQTTPIKIDMMLLKSLMVKDANAEMCRALLLGLHDYSIGKDFVEISRFLVFIYREIDLVVYILKTDSKATDSVRNTLKIFFKQYTEYLFTAESWKGIVFLFGIISFFDETHVDLLTPEMKETVNQTVCIEFDDGPLYIKKYKLLVLAKNSCVIERLLFGDYRDAAEFSVKNTVVLKDVARKDFRLLLSKYSVGLPSISQFTPKELIKLNLLSEFLDIPSIRDDTKVRFQAYLEGLSKNEHGFFTNESFDTIFELCSVIVELDLYSLIDSCIAALKLKNFNTTGPVYDVWLGRADLPVLERYFRQYCLYYSLRKKYLAKQLPEIHKNDVAPYIEHIVHLAPNDLPKFETILEYLTIALITQPFEKGCQFEEKTEFGDFLIVDKMDVGLKLDLSRHPIRMGVLEAMKGLFVSELKVLKDSFSKGQLLRIAEFFPGVVIIEV